MIVYEPGPAGDYQWVVPEQGGYIAIRDRLSAHQGSRIADRWVPPRLQVLAEDDDGRELRQADMPWFGGDGLVVTARAREVLEPVLSQDAEFLEVEEGGQKLWFVNAWRTIDALDEDHSVVKRFPGSGKVMDIRKYVFSESSLQGVL
jgi:hypothetical protein